MVSCRKDSNVNFTEEAKQAAQLTQELFHKYDRGYRLVEPRCLTKFFHKAPKQEDWRIPKMDGAGPGTYDSTKAYDKFVSPREFLVSKQTENRTGFTDAYAKLFKANPDMQHYREVDRGFRVVKPGQGTFETIKFKNS